MDVQKNLRASRTGNKLNRAVSDESLNQDLIGIALSWYVLYAPGDLSRMNIDKRSEQMAFKSLVLGKPRKKCKTST